MTEGKQFEKDFKDSVPDDVFLYRFKDGTANWGDKNENTLTRFQAQNICDFMIFTGARLFLLELKTTKSLSLSYNNIRDNQVKEMTKAVGFINITAGFIVNFRTVNKTFFMSIALYNKCVEKLDRKSIPLSVFENHAVLIQQEQKLVHWRYDIEQLISCC
jgi:penicillin-binding protein-related factor A (putative recombinase)